ncbi:flavodoxin domain-containing protein [Leuconostocaceae bacterium ESL0958]|nr:flavodoxin domain-containing protein [Leuconostocaceae bacterium ESL0958]
MENQPLTAQVVFATITGNNEAVADIIVEALEAAGVNVNKAEISQVEPEELADYSLFFLVPYTYDEGSLPDEGLDYFDDLAAVDLHEQVYGLAGSGDRFYEDDYCLALDKFQQQLVPTGAKQAGDIVRINLLPNEKDAQALRELVATALAAVQK